MQTCSKCNSQMLDIEKYCSHCQAELEIHSISAVSRLKLGENPRVRDVRVVISDNACPACKEISKTYPKDNLPHLPVKGCSHKDGCRCFYEPMLTTIFP